MITATRWHEIDAGHRVVGQGGQCEHLHGHRYRITFTITADALNDIGMVLDFGVIKKLLCTWLDENWDHRLLIADFDPMLKTLQGLDPNGVQKVPFNPTAENLAGHLLHFIGPNLLVNEACSLIEVTVQETGKCSATAKK